MITYCKIMAAINVLGMFLALVLNNPNTFKLHAALALFFVITAIAKEYDNE